MHLKVGERKICDSWHTFHYSFESFAHDVHTQETILGHTVGPFRSLVTNNYFSKYALSVWCHYDCFTAPDQAIKPCLFLLFCFSVKNNAIHLTALIVPYICFSTSCHV